MSEGMRSLVAEVAQDDKPTGELAESLLRTVPIGATQSRRSSRPSSEIGQGSPTVVSVGAVQCD